MHEKWGQVTQQTGSMWPVSPITLYLLVLHMHEKWGQVTQQTGSMWPVSPITLYLLALHIHEKWGQVTSQTRSAWSASLTMVAFTINNTTSPICLSLFTIKSRSAQRHLRKIWLRRHLRKIWLHGKIFISHAHEACDVSVPVADSKWPIIGTEVLWDMMT